MQNLSRIEERIVKASVASLDWRGNLEPFARKKVREIAGNCEEQAAEKGRP